MTGVPRAVSGGAVGATLPTAEAIGATSLAASRLALGEFVVELNSHASAFLFGAVVYWLIINPALDKPHLVVVFATMALSIFLKESVKSFYSAEAQPFIGLKTQDFHGVDSPDRLRA